MYKKSFYNLEYDYSENQKMLYNTLTGAFVLLDEYHYDLYSNIENIGISEEVESIITSLSNNGIIIDKNINEKMIVKTYENTARYGSNTLSLTIAPTLACNMDCPYCYEKNKAGKMTQDTLDALVEFTKNKINSYGYKNLNITWYGGEPLLQVDTIEHLSLKFKQICKELKLSYSANIVTNGSLITKDIAKMLVDTCSVSISQITIDGLAEKNDKRRLLKNGEGSFDLIVKNIKDVRDILNIRIRVNVDKENSNELNQLMDYYKKELEHPNVSIYIAPVTGEGENCNKHLCYTSKEFVDIQRRFLNNMDFIQPLPKSIPISCAAIGTSSFVVGPDGELFKCWNEIGNKEQSIGNVKDGELLNKRALEWLNYSVDERCNECKMIPICQGSCPYPKISGENPICDYQMYLIKETLDRVCATIKDSR